MRSISRPVCSLILASFVLILATSCTSDSGEVGKVDTTEPALPAEGDSSSGPSSRDLDPNELVPPAIENGVESTEIAVPKPAERQIPQALKDAPTKKVVQQFADKTTHREFTAKFAGKGYMFHGLYTEYYQGGAKQKQGQYEYGQKTGEWTFWGKNGVVRKKGIYVDDKQEGEWQKHREDGSLEWIERYQNGLTHGTWKAFQADGKTVIWERTYKHGKRHGLWINYYPDGSKVSVETYENGKRNGSSKSWFENGKVNMEGEYVDGERHGTFRVFAVNGDLKDEVEWESGKVRVGS